MGPSRQNPADVAEPVLPSTASSGIEGLDQMLRGGFLGMTCISSGDAGTGKTTLGLQFLRSRSPGRRARACSSPWSQSAQRDWRDRRLARKAARRDRRPRAVPRRDRGAAGPQTVLHTADVELGELAARDSRGRRADPAPSRCASTRSARSAS